MARTNTNTGGGGGSGTVTSFSFVDGSGFDGTVLNPTTTPTLSLTTQLTLGSVPFIGASGALSQDNSKLFWDNTNKRLGIGLNTPAKTLDVLGTSQFKNGTVTIDNQTGIDQVLGFGASGTTWKIDQFSNLTANTLGATNVNYTGASVYFDGFMRVGTTHEAKIVSVISNSAGTIGQGSGLGIIGDMRFSGPAGSMVTIGAMYSNNGSELESGIPMLQIGGFSTDYLGDSAVSPTDYTTVRIAQKYNITKSASTLTGIDYNPTLVAMAGTHLAMNLHSGSVKINDLSGSGTRMVTASPTGVLSTATIPGGTIGGTIATNEIAFGTATNTIGSTPQFTWNDTIKFMQISGSVGASFQFSGSSDGGYFDDGNVTANQTGFYSANGDQLIAGVNIGSNEYRYGNGFFTSNDSTAQFIVNPNGLGTGFGFGLDAVNDVFVVTDSGIAGNKFLLIDKINNVYSLGDVDGVFNATRLLIDDNAQEIHLENAAIFFDSLTNTSPNNVLRTFGDGSVGNSFVAAVVGSNDATGLTAAQNNFINYTAGSGDETLRVGGYLTVTAISVNTITFQVVYTDETNTSRTVSFFPQGTTVAAVGTTGPFTFPDIQIRVKAGTTINVKTITTGAGSQTYDLGVTVERMR